MTLVEERPPRILPWFIVAAALYWTLALFPTPARILSDAAQCYQLAAALDILAGHHPVLDFDETYGPLTFYTSAIGQWATGTRVIGEIALIAPAFALSYVLLYRLMLACHLSWKIALVMTLAAIVAQPAGFRYYILLGPLAILTAGWRYLDAPGHGRLAWLALAIAVAGLFRPDVGVYGFLASVVLVSLSGVERRWREVGMLTLFVILWALPWLLWVAWHGKLVDYLYISSLEATVEAVGRAKPPPMPDFSMGLLVDRNVKAFLFRLPTLMLIVAGGTLVIRRKALHGPLRARLWTAFALAALTSLQASHIVDWMHIRDTFSVRFLLLGWVVSEACAAFAERRKSRVIWLVPLGFVTLFIGATAAGTFLKETERTVSPLRLAAKLREFCGTRAEVLAGVHERGESFRAGLYEYVRDHTTPQETVFGLLELPQMNYFADRRFASRQMALFPGYFSSPRQQQRLMAEIRSGPTAFVVIDSLVMLDYPEGSLELFAPDVLRFLKEEFVLAAEFGYCQVLVPRWRKDAPVGARNWWEPRRGAP